MNVTVAMGLILCNYGLESDLAKQGDNVYTIKATILVILSTCLRNQWKPKILWCSSHWTIWFSYICRRITTNLGI